MTILDRLHAPRPDGLRLLLVFLLITPVTLAHASPPDQTWFAGVYDQADLDDVVGLLTSALEATEPTTAPETGSYLALVSKLCPPTAAGTASVFTYSAPLRAPPIA